MGHFEFFKALRSKIGISTPIRAKPARIGDPGAARQPTGSREKSGLSMFYDPSKLQYRSLKKKLNPFNQRHSCAAPNGA